jgi:hypothetical protein
MPTLPPIPTPTPTTATLLPVLAVDWEQIKKFRSILQAKCIETCSCYKERWFQIGLATEGNNIGVCKACIKDANKLKDLTLPPLFSESNGLNPGPIPSFLPIFTAVEELLIARVYVYLQVVYIRGQQYRYTGYVCCFSQNILKT